MLIAAIAMVACTRPTPFTVREDLRYLVVGPAEVPDPVILALELDASPVVFAPSSSTFWALGYPRFDRGAAWLPVTTRAQPLMGAQLPVLPFPAPAEALRVFDGEVSGGIDVGAVPLAPDTPCVLVPSGPRRGLGARAEIQGSARTSSRSVTLLTRDGAIAAVGPAAFGSAADGLVPLPWGAPGARPVAIAWDEDAQELHVLASRAADEPGLLLGRARPLDAGHRRWSAFDVTPVARGDCSAPRGNVRARLRRDPSGRRQLLTFDTSARLQVVEDGRCRTILAAPGALEDPAGMEVLDDGTALVVDGLTPRLWVLGAGTSSIASAELTPPVDGVVPTALMIEPHTRSVVIGWAIGGDKASAPTAPAFTTRAIDGAEWTQRGGWTTLDVQSPPWGVVPGVRRIAVLAPLDDGFVATGNPAQLVRYVFTRDRRGALGVIACPHSGFPAATLTIGAPLGDGRWAFAGGAIAGDPENALWFVELPPMRR